MGASRSTLELSCPRSDASLSQGPRHGSIPSGGACVSDTDDDVSPQLDRNAQIIDAVNLVAALSAEFDAAVSSPSARAGGGVVDVASSLLDTLDGIAARLLHPGAPLSQMGTLLAKSITRLRRRVALIAGGGA